MKLMTHVVIGYPSLDATVELVKTMVAAGADMVELQIPFSDPMADGPTIMKACEVSLSQGTKVADAFTIMKQLSKEVSVPLYFMAYYNTVFHYPSTSLRTSGVEKFCKDAKESGATGLIVPDMPIEEESEEHFFSAMAEYGLDNIRVVSPVSTDERLRLNAEYGSVLRHGNSSSIPGSPSFVYATARQGITGVQDSRLMIQDLRNFLDRVRKYFDIPVAVGFGISKKEQVQALEGIADIAIVGSVIIDRINNSTDETMIKNINNFIRELCHPGK